MSTLSDRYVHAVVSQLPAGQREEISKELRATIQDAVEARSGVDPDQAERAALIELGHPSALADNYRGEPKALIGPRVYDSWLATLRLLLMIVPPIAGLVVLLIGLIQKGGLGTELVIDALVAAAESALQVLAFVTLGFFIADRQGVDVAGFVPGPDRDTWTPEDLPDPAERQVSWSEAAWSIVGSGVGIAVISAIDQTVVFEGKAVEVLTANAMMWRWVVVAGFVVGIVAAVFTMVRGHWTMPTAVTNLVANILIGAPIITLLALGDLFTPAMADLVAPAGLGQWAAVNTGIIQAIIAVILIWDTIDAFRSAARAQAREGVRGRREV